MNIIEEFRIWEDLWDGQDLDNSEILFTSDQGRTFNLANEDEFEAALKAEEEYYRNTYMRRIKNIRVEFALKTNNVNVMTFRRSVDKLIASGVAEAEAEAQVEDRWVAQHMELYYRDLCYNLNIGLAKQSRIDDIKVTLAGEPYIIKHYSKVFDLTDERSLVDYIDYYFVKYKHARAKPHVWINSLQNEKLRVVSRLAARGLYDLAKKASARIDSYISKRISELEQ